MWVELADATRPKGVEYKLVEAFLKFGSWRRNRGVSFRPVNAASPGRSPWSLILSLEPNWRLATGFGDVSP